MPERHAIARQQIGLRASACRQHPLQFRRREQFRSRACRRQRHHAWITCGVENSHHQGTDADGGRRPAARRQAWLFEHRLARGNEEPRLGSRLGDTQILEVTIGRDGGGDADPFAHGQLAHRRQPVTSTEGAGSNGRRQAFAERSIQPGLWKRCVHEALMMARAPLAAQIQNPRATSDTDAPMPVCAASQTGILSLSRHRPSP